VSVRSLFPTLIYTTRLSKHAGLNRELLREAYAFREIDEEGRRWSAANYVSGYTSYSSVADLPYRSPTFARLQRLIDPHVKRYARELEMDLRGRKLEMTTCWINVMGVGCHHSSHLHPLSAISGTYFVQVPKGAGAFKIEDPRLACFMGSPPRAPKSAERNRRFVNLAPKPGEILLFESWLRHEVPANRAREDRVSISFNYDWV
jgi:uncharacterized protein (TIGR02466 family)